MFANFTASFENVKIPSLKYLLEIGQFYPFKCDLTKNILPKNGFFSEFFFHLHIADRHQSFVRENIDEKSNKIPNSSSTVNSVTHE